MNKSILGGSSVLLILILIGFVFVLAPSDSFAQKKDPKCRFRNPDTNMKVKYRCDRFQSKGDIDEVTPQLKIIAPAHGAVIDYSTLQDSNDNGSVELPITIVISPDSDYTVDFTAATNAATEYAFQPQVAGLGHAHAYIAPAIDVEQDELGNVTGVNFVGSDNRSDFVGGFCVFRQPEVMNDNYQVLKTNCELFQTMETIVEGAPYRVIVDTTENSHGPRLKKHPRDVPPGDQVNIQFTNVAP